MITWYYTYWSCANMTKHIMLVYRTQKFLSESFYQCRWPVTYGHPLSIFAGFAIPPPSLFRQFKQVSKTVVKLIQKPYYIFGFLWLTGGVVKMMNPDQCYNFLSILLMLNRAQKRHGISPILRWGEGVSPRSGPGAVKVQLCKPGTEIWRRAKPWKSQNQYW